MEAQAHPRQSERLRALYSYEILDTDREKEFDEVVKLAAEICGTTVSLITLVDAERQWFKAEVGLGMRETPLSESVCSHVILGADFIEIEDTLQDPRMVDNPLCCGDPGLRFYAGALLKSDAGLPIGTLCVLDWTPRRLTPLQRDAIKVLARQVMAQLDLRRALRLAETLRREVDHRVKNSLQLLSSLTRIEARAVKSEETKFAIESVQRRVQTVAMLHELLYKTTAEAQIQLGDYFEKIADFLDTVAPPNVAVQSDAQSVTVTSSEAASVGILLNEFATNSFKHAFPDDRPGVVRFSLGRSADGLILIECSDDGVGLANGAGKADAGLGFKIAEAVSGQLGCRLQIDEKMRGMSARIAFRSALD